VALTAVSLFSGCGGFDWGAKQAGVQILWANDNDPYAAAAYQALLPEVGFVEGDVRDVGEFPDADILIGCYPCTGFSVGALRRWRDGRERNLQSNNNNHLYLEFLRALEQVQPRYFFVENVRGMRAAAKGWFFKEQLRCFSEAGEFGYTVKHKVLDASHYGVPQARKRLFIVGVRKDIKEFKYKFPEPTHGPGTKKPFVFLRQAIWGMKRWPHGEYLELPFHGHYLTRQRKRGWDELSYTIVANAHHVPLHPMGQKMKYVDKDKWSLCGKSNRRLSWRECAAIQGLPSVLEPSGGLLDKYRVVGNAVPPAVGQALVKPVVDFETADD
jgi:DNA (cytosine-5)-methyltransferase 1